jgi:carnitine 3-dehydrogenase
MAFVTNIKTFAALGSGVIGSGWVAPRWPTGWTWSPGTRRPAPKRRCARASPSAGARWSATGLKPGASPDRLRFVATIEECVADADFIQESAPETLSLKLDLHTRRSAPRPARMC